MSDPLAHMGRNYIDGAWVAGGDGEIAVDDPGTGQPIMMQALADAADVDRAVASARACFETGDLYAMRPSDRGRMVRKMGDWFREHSGPIAEALSREAGKPLWESRLEIEGAARYFEYYGNQAETMEGRSIPLGAGYLDFTVLEPRGISAQIIPWNYPLEMAARSLAPALATGNTCVVKSPELDPLTSACLAEAAEAVGMPKGAVNILCGRGAVAGAALASHPDVDQIVFTGSVATGISIATAAARNVVPCVLELGGKSAAVAFDDANLDDLMDNIRWGIFFNSGQVCSAMSRLIVPKGMMGEVTERAAALAQSIDVGPGIERPDFGPNMGAMISEGQRDRAEAMCREAEREGAKLAAGGNRLNRPGWFLQPTIFSDVSPDMGIARNEVFGPVLSIIGYEDEADAVRIANGTDYGLVAGVFSADVDRALRMAGDLKAGQIFINEWYAGGVETPFGGFKQSGYGREKGREALLNYVQTKNIAAAVRPRG